MSTQPPLTEAEQAAAEALAVTLNRHEVEAGNVDSWVAADFADRARAVVAAVRKVIEAEALGALADAAENYGPPSVDHLRALAFIARQGRSTVDWAADALSRSTSKETPWPPTASTLRTLSASWLTATAISTASWTRSSTCPPPAGSRPSR